MCSPALGCQRWINLYLIICWWIVCVCKLYYLLTYLCLQSLSNSTDFSSSSRLQQYAFHGAIINYSSMMPSVLWRCWLGVRKGIWPVKKLSGGVLAWLSVWSEVQTCIWPSWCHWYSLSLASVKSRLVSPFWYRLTLVSSRTKGR